MKFQSGNYFIHSFKNIYWAIICQTGGVAEDTAAIKRDKITCSQRIQILVGGASGKQMNKQL